MNKEIFLLITYLTSLMLSGCVLEEGIVALYTDEDGKVKMCPVVAGARGEELSIDQYQYIQYYSSETETEDDPTELMTCLREDCHSETDCCGLDRDQAKIYYHSFRLGLCPKKMTCKTEEGNTDVFYCSKPQANCTDEQYECGGVCVNVNSDMDHCGQCFIKCSTKNEEMQNSTETVCKEGKCVATRCEAGFHLTASGKCVGDSVKLCGGKNCEVIEGWLDGECSPTGECIVNKCKPGYHKYKNDSGSVVCELDTIEHCGKHDIVCEKTPGVRYVICNEDAVCEATKCEKDFHWNRDNTGCTEDSVEECGWFNNNCNALSGWKKDGEGNECRTGYNCFAGECKDGYHVYNQEEYGINVPCEADTNEHCGSHDNNCAERNLMCSNGECSKDCAAGYQPCNGSCVKFSDDNKNCGGCGIECKIEDIAEASSVTCQDSFCVPSTCNEGFHVNGNNCVLDSWEHCGTGNVLCDATLIPNGAAFNCEGGQCKVVACLSGYHVYNNYCEPDNNSKCGNDNLDCSVAIPYGNAACENGICVLQSCYSGYHVWGNTCEQNSNENCGSHGNVCKNIKNMIYSCNVASGECETEGACESGYANCNKRDGDGCEVNLSNWGLASCTGCAKGYNKCGTYSGNMPLCLKYNTDIISTAYCKDYCNCTDSMGGQGNKYHVKQCNPGERCFMDHNYIFCE